MPPEAEFSRERRIGLAQASLRLARSWMGLHRELEAIGFAVEKTGRGGRVLDVETARHVPLGRVATSMPLLELVRRRDGQRVVWDLHEHRAIDHGYATTSYRSQGRTVDSVFALASSA